MNCDVVVIGAGVAGMLAARTLARAGRSVVLLEARERAGGRLLSVADPRALAPIELGGEFVHGRPQITYDLLREFGATVVDDAEGSFTVRDGVLRPFDADPFAAAAELLARALERDTDESVDALVERVANDAASRETATWVRRLVTGFDAADTARASARAIAQEWAGDASAEGAQSRPLGGYAPLVAHLARGLDPVLVDVRFGAVATRVAWAADGARVDAIVRGREKSFAARRCLIAVPHGVLTAPPGAEGALAFDPPLPAATRSALALIATGPVAKVVLRFRTAFWESLGGGAWRDGAFFSGDGPFPTLWTQLPVRANTLVAWAGGPAAAALGSAGEDAWIRLALDCAGAYFGATRAAEEAFEAGYCHDWQRDPFSRGAYTYALVGGEGARETLAVAVGDTLWFAGEATASGGEGGTVAGALESGRRAATEIVKAW
jgi:monoamine oxidase